MVFGSVDGADKQKTEPLLTGLVSVFELKSIQMSFIHLNDLISELSQSLEDVHIVWSIGFRIIRKRISFGSLDFIIGTFETFEHQSTTNSNHRHIDTKLP